MACRGTALLFVYGKLRINICKKKRKEMQRKISRQQEISKKEQHRQMRQQNTDERVPIVVPQLFIV
jgi:hypothetical protein